MVKNIISHKYPQRKNKFKKMVTEVWSQGLFNKKSRQILSLKHSTNSNESTKWFSKDPERWNNFQKEYQGEFDEKIKLLDEIKHKKKDNEVFYLIEAADFVN